MAKTHRTHEEATIEMLRKDPELAADYLNSVLEDGDAGRFPLELNMTRTNETWRVTGIHNLRPMLETAIARAGL